jgi:hypothetical protein
MIVALTLIFVGFLIAQTILVKPRIWPIWIIHKKRMIRLWELQCQRETQNWNTYIRETFINNAIRKPPADEKMPALPPAPEEERAPREEREPKPKSKWRLCGDRHD